MRIIAGRFRGRTLRRPKSHGVRPTADRVREALFSILGQRVRDSRVLDLFAGTGALGLEALSRGAACAVFVDQHREALAVLRSNVDRCGVTFPEVEVLAVNVPVALSRLAAQKRRFDLIFMDPPYGLGWIPKILALLDAVAAPDALIIAEHHEKDAVPDRVSLWHLVDRRRYGTVCLTFFARMDEAPEGEG
ncbi:16S rRNA (guanine966-N2)-methyltransferase [Desulfosoma caldarium]|uniref:16S rRNA (Guanine966-N2)-methyltransferase n=2 Tax=Desulfosoma caldarium TaxID=610254 RepID=A0A3N1UMA4_9BACT|nr:16S rRNA (guanine966-N2)-methyltransferase [Desulfosoma caldarium]